MVRAHAACPHGRASDVDPDRARADVDERIAEIGAENIAALVTEPIQGTGGVNPPRGDYLRDLAALCRANDILLILDEVITGFGRTGTMFAAEFFGPAGEFEVVEDHGPGMPRGEDQPPACPYWRAWSVQPGRVRNTEVGSARRR